MSKIILNNLYKGKDITYPRDKANHESLAVEITFLIVVLIGLLADVFICVGAVFICAYSIIDTVFKPETIFASLGIAFFTIIFFSNDIMNEIRDVSESTAVIYCYRHHLKSRK